MNLSGLLLAKVAPICRHTKERGYRAQCLVAGRKDSSNSYLAAKCLQSYNDELLITRKEWDSMGLR